MEKVMNRLILGFACVALLAVSVHARTEPRVTPASWTVAETQSIQSARVHSLVGSSFHAIHASF